MAYLDKYKVHVPEGEAGSWKVKCYTVTADNEKLQRIRAIFNGGRYVPAGTYTQLTRNGSLVMSDTPDEIRDHWSFICKASGNVLINGLGLGMVLQAILNKSEVDKATVIEISPEVVALVGEHYQEHYGSRLEIIQADALTWQPPKGTRYFAIWHDIWSDICSGNLPEMHKLHRRYGHRCNWQGSWGRALIGKEGRWQTNSNFYL